MIIQEIRDQLRSSSSPEERRKRVHWEKQYQEKPRIRGIPTPAVRRMSSVFFQKIKTRPKHEILWLCNELLRSGYSEEMTIAFDWAFRIRRLFQESDFGILEKWLKTYVHGWGACDDLCTHSLGAFLLRFPKFLRKTVEWTKSKNRWIRRASAVVLIYSIRREKNLGSVLETADRLLTDEDVMVQKGYGWMLKEASKRYPQEIFDYVMRNKKEMPRTALRYAIEKLSPERRVAAMKKESE